MLKDNNHSPNDEYNTGKISLHFHGEGVPSPEQVQARAEELAIIDGLKRSEVNEGHLREARKELLGEEAEPEDVLEEGDEISESDEVLGESGTQTPNYGSDDETSIGEKLVNQGMDEATHDEMRVASETLDRQNRGLEHDDRDELPD